MMRSLPSDKDRAEAGNSYETNRNRKNEDGNLYLTVPMGRNASSSSSWSSSSGASSAYSYYEGSSPSVFPSFSGNDSKPILKHVNGYPDIIASQQFLTHESSSSSSSLSSSSLLQCIPRNPENTSKDVARVSEEDLPLFDPRCGDPKLHWSMYYEHHVGDHETFWRLKKGYLMSAEFPEKRPDEVINSKSKRSYPCPYPGCKSEPLRRSWDLKRHYKTHCPSQEDEKIYCDYTVCPGSRNKNPFERRDHCREHYRDVHKEDLIKRNMDENAEDWLVDRQTSPSWWRCSRCLHKKKVRKHGYNCDECNVPCESKRVIVRQQKIEKAEAEEQRLQQQLAGKCSALSTGFPRIEHENQQLQTVANRYSVSSTAIPRSQGQYAVNSSMAEQLGNGIIANSGPNASSFCVYGDNYDAFDADTFTDELNNNSNLGEFATQDYI